MDHVEKRRRRSEFANEPELGDRDRALLVTAQGREPGAHAEHSGAAEQELADQGAGASPRSEITDHPDQGGDEETDDGLNASDEALRRAAEDEPGGRDGTRLPDRLPVFDRGDTPPKI